MDLPAGFLERLGHRFDELARLRGYVWGHVRPGPGDLSAVAQRADGRACRETLAADTLACFLETITRPDAAADQLAAELAARLPLP